MRAGMARLDVAARNIAGAATSGDEAYRPITAVQESTGEGGVRTSLSERSPAFTSYYDPELSGADANGMVNFPNVDTTSELIDGMQASLTYKANASVLRTAGDMAGTLFDILG